jgi:hypothetical protein
MRVFQVNEKSHTRVSKGNHRRTSPPKIRATLQSHTTPVQPKPVKKTKDDLPRVEVEKHVFGMSPGIRRLQEAEVRRYADYQESVAKW